KPVDVDLHQIGLAVKVPIPDVLDDLAASHQVGGVQKKELEQGEFLGSQWNGLFAPRSAAAVPVELEVGIVETGIPAVQPAPHERTHASEEFGKNEWFREVIISPGVQALDALFHKAARGQHEHRRFGTLLPQFAADLDAAHARQADVQQDCIVGYVGIEFQRL